MTTFGMKDNRLTLIASLFLVPALVLEAAGMSKFYWSPTNPIYLAFEAIFSNSAWLSWLAQGLVLVGPVIAVLLCALTILHVSVRREADTLVSTVAIKMNWLSLTLVALGLLGMAVIALYIIGENAPCILGYKVSC